MPGKEPDPDTKPYRPAPIPNPGKPPWPGYPNPKKLAKSTKNKKQIQIPTKQETKKQIRKEVKRAVNDPNTFV